MRHGKVGTCALALVLVAATANHAQGQLPAAPNGGVFTRFFKRPATAARAEKEERTTPEVAPAARLAQAQADWLRRQEVCLKLRHISLETADDDLWRKADQLEQRAWDAFVQQTGQSPNATPATDEAILGQHLASTEDTPSRLSRSLGTVRRGQKDTGQAALGEDR
jgi:hypothetical protein